jgi:hypothetical protein
MGYGLKLRNHVILDNMDDVKEVIMTNKSLLVLVLIALVTMGAFAVPEFRLSVGAGGYITNDIGATGTLGELADVRRIMSNEYTGIGGFLFLDATFGELSLGFFGGNGSFDDYYEDNNDFHSTSFSNSIVGFDIGLIGKYPFAIGPKVKIFPLLGINYRIIAGMGDEDDRIKDAGNHSALWVRLGVGMDIFFLPSFVTKNIFLRLGLTGGLRLSNKFEKDMAEYYESLGMDAKAYPGFGFDFKLAIGYRF